LQDQLSTTLTQHSGPQLITPPTVSVHHIAYLSCVSCSITRLQSFLTVSRVAMVILRSSWKRLRSTFCANATSLFMSIAEIVISFIRESSRWNTLEEDSAFLQIKAHTVHSEILQLYWRLFTWFLYGIITIIVKLLGCLSVWVFY